MKRDNTEDYGDLPLVKRNRLIYSPTKDGEVVGYTPEEYGIVPAIEPKATTTWSAAIWFGISLTALLSITTLLIGIYVDRGDDAPLAMWLIPLLLIALTSIFGRRLQVEIRARKLRKDRGLPEPVE